MIIGFLWKKKTIENKNLRIAFSFIYLLGHMAKFKIKDIILLVLL